MRDYWNLVLFWGLFIGISLAISIMSCVVVSVEIDENRKLKIWLLSIIAVFSCICIVVDVVGGIHLNNWSFTKKEYEILSLDLNNEVTGHFVLGSGSIEEDTYYYFYYQTDKGIKLGKVPTSNSYLYETDEKEPSIWTIKKQGDSPYRTIYIPTDSIRIEYDPNF